MIKTFIQQEEKIFDKQFGETVFDSGGFPYTKGGGRWAGCDNCSENCKLRVEHKQFHKAGLERLVREVKLIILKNSKEEYDGTTSFLTANTDKIMLEINNLI